MLTSSLPVRSLTRVMIHYLSPDRAGSCPRRGPYAFLDCVQRACVSPGESMSSRVQRESRGASGAPLRVQTCGEAEVLASASGHRSRRDDPHSPCNGGSMRARFMIAALASVVFL